MINISNVGFGWIHRYYNLSLRIRTQCVNLGLSWSIWAIWLFRRLLKTHKSENLEIIALRIIGKSKGDKIKRVSQNSRNKHPKLPNVWIPQTYYRLIIIATKAEDAFTKAIDEVSIQKAKWGFKSRNLSQYAVPIANKCKQFFIRWKVLWFRCIPQIIIVTIFMDNDLALLSLNCVVINMRLVMVELIDFETHRHGNTG